MYTYVMILVRIYMGCACSIHDRSRLLFAAGTGDAREDFFFFVSEVESVGHMDILGVVFQLRADLY